MAFIEDKSQGGLSRNVLLFGLLILLAGSLLGIGYMAYLRSLSEKSNAKLKSRSDSLAYSNGLFKDSVRILNDESIELNEKVEELMQQKDKLTGSRDSVARLLAYSRANERNAVGKVAVLEKKLKELQTKLNSIQAQYDDLLANSGSAGAEYKQRLESLTAERDNLAKENQRLKQDLGNATTNADNRTAIFANSMSAVPGELVKNKFSASTRSQNTDRAQVAFSLSRAPKPNETIIFKIFDATNKEVAIKPKYRNELNAPANPVNQRVILEFEKGKLDRSSSGRYSVRMYLTAIDKGIENQEIGVSSFEVK